MRRDTGPPDKGSKVMKTLSELLTPAERAAVRAPIETARTLPRRAFVDEDFHAYEVEHALKESWFAVTFATEIPGAGDMLPLTVLGLPVLLVRGRDGIARAFHNICPYDGCEVSTGPQSGVETIVTPYHGWKYGLDGRLLEAGYWDGTPKAEESRLDSLNADLVPIPCEEWMSTLFLYLGRRPLPFAEQYGPMLEHFASIDLDRLRIGLDENGEPMVRSLPIGANWKTVYENYAPNVYHESFVHAMYRRSPHSPRVDEERNKTYTEINHPSGHLGLCYDNKIGDSLYGKSTLPRVLNRDGSPNRVNTISNVYPNWVTTMLGDTARIALFLPDGPEHGTQVVATFFDRDGAEDPAHLKDRQRALRAGLLARREDNRICESVQRARRSPAVDSQFYSPFWDAMHYTLSNLILDKLEEGERADNH